MEVNCFVSKEFLIIKLRKNEIDGDVREMRDRGKHWGIK
jgi:hypothetical protein